MNPTSTQDETLAGLQSRMHRAMVFGDYDLAERVAAEASALGKWDKTVAISPQTLAEGLLLRKPDDLEEQLGHKPPLQAWLEKEGPDTVKQLARILTLGSEPREAIELIERYNSFRANLGMGPDQNFTSRVLAPFDLPDPNTNNVRAFLVALEKPFDETPGVFGDRITRAQIVDWARIELAGGQKIAQLHHTHTDMRAIAKERDKILDHAAEHQHGPSPTFDPTHAPQQTH